MFVLDRYIAGRFLRALFFSLLVFLVIYIIADLVEHLDEFIDAHAHATQVIRYYAHYIPYIIVFTLPVSMLLATLFSVGTLSKSNELLAMKASGISLYRVALSLLSIAFVISLLSMVFSETVVPASNQTRWDIKKIEIEKQDTQRSSIIYNLYRQGDHGRIFRFERYDVTQAKGYGAMVQEFDGKSLKSTVRASEMTWQDSAWVLKIGEERRFDGPDSFSVRTFDYEAHPEWPERPAVFAERYKEPANMDYFELRRRAATKEKAGADATEERVDMQFRIASPFSSFLMVLLGIPIAAAPKRAGFAISFGITFLIGIVYFTVSEVLHSIGKAGGLSPLVAAWAINILFLVIGLALLASARK
jgi:lipopolysaccharide export system permease protein